MPKPLKVYVYKNCDTCRRALKFLDAHNVPYQSLPIRETPPSPAELRRMLKHLDNELPKLFNTSGRDYRELAIKDRIKTLMPDEAFQLLASSGNLVKRPFAIAADTGAVGFREDEWKSKFLS
jgi:arsenate reductase